MAQILSILLLPALFTALGCSSQAGTGESVDAGTPVQHKQLLRGQRQLGSTN